MCDFAYILCLRCNYMRPVEHIRQCYVAQARLVKFCIYEFASVKPDFLKGPEEDTVRTLHQIRSRS